MNKIILIAILLLSASSNIFAKTIDISYKGSSLTKKMQLSTNDVVMINTTVNIGTRVLISVKPISHVPSHSFTFKSSMMGVNPNRIGEFTDQMYTGANPGWVSYTYTGDKNVQAQFILKP